MMRPSLRFKFTLIALSSLPLMAADPFYLGTWKITTAVVAPWADPAARKPDPTEMKSLVGKVVVFKTNEITGPRQVACKGPKYLVKDYPADMLFQGAFGEMKLKNPVRRSRKTRRKSRFHR